MSAPHVHVQRDTDAASGVVTLILDDEPRKNAMTEALGDRLRDAVTAVAADASVRAVVLCGAGGAFSSGGDLAMLERLRGVPHDVARAHMRAFYARYLSVLDLPVPTIAAVRGAAIGAGLCVALACDLVVVGDDAKLAFNFVKLGLHPGMGATLLVPRRVGAQRAAELLLTGRRFDGREAVQMGLALVSVPDTEVVPHATNLARELAANGPQAVQALTRALRVDADSLERALEREARHQADSYGSEDLGEGLAAAAARRPPRFQGR